VSRVVWTPQAIADVAAIRDYISGDSRRYAALVVDQIVRAVGRLELFPLSGRRVSERPDPELRELLCGNHRVVYRVAGGLIEVVTIFHGYRVRRIPWEVREARIAS